MNRDKTKIVTYIHRLDEARCNGDWNAVPRLVRKIRKYAPQRACITLAAETEYTFAKERYQQPLGSTSTSVSHVNLSNLSERQKLLSEAISQEGTNIEDSFHAQACLDLIHWHQGKSSIAISNLPVNFVKEFVHQEGVTKESLKWTSICALKIVYFKGNLLHKENATSGALEVYSSSLPVLLSLISNPGQGNEIRLWVELFLTGFCTTYSDALKKNFSQKLLSNTLLAFRYWNNFWDNHTSTPVGGRNLLADVDRRYVWREYYYTLSNLFKYELPFPTILSLAYPKAPIISQLRIELKRVETQYESLIMSEVSFPKAQCASTEVEGFIEVVVQNWRALCGTNFNDHDLGEGGGESLSRNVIDILYRAAKKTFHSTAILRYLFILHLAVSEFDLAFRAFDTYMVIVKKGKARLQRTDESIPGFDTDDTILKVTSQYIKELCRCGSHKWAGKAFQVCQFLEDWLETYDSTSPNVECQRIPFNQNQNSRSYVSPQTIALAWRSIGIGYAQWARATFDAASRSDIQSRAISCLRKALLPQYESSKSPETLYALGILLAERRQIDAAIQVVKTGLLLTSSNNHLDKLYYGDRRFSKEILIIPLWHLLALLLSARQEFNSAVKSCDGAFEQFDGPQNLFGEAESNESEKISDQNQGAIDEMDIFEKENLLEVKMTQLALIELLEGPDVAVNSSDEVLCLYTRCFGDPQTNGESNQCRKFLITPKSSAEKSIKGSLFGCSGQRPDSSDNADGAKEISAPTIHVTGDVDRPKRYRSATISQADCVKSQKNPIYQSGEPEKIFGYDEDERGRKRSLSSGSSLRQSDNRTHGQWQLNSNIKNKRYASMKPMSKSSPKGSSGLRHSKTVFNETNSQNDENSSRPTLAPKSNYALPISQLYIVKLPKYSSESQQKRYKMSILVKIWLHISGFYRRASMYEDAQAAIDEARLLTDFIEINFPSESSKYLAADEYKLGEGKPVAELWSNIYTELGYLAMAEGSPHVAAVQFENALTHSRDHPNAIVGLSNILMSIYTGDLLPPPSIPALTLPTPITPHSSLDRTTAYPILSSLHESSKYLSNISNAFQIPRGLAVPEIDKVPLKNLSSEQFTNLSSICSHENNHKDQSITLLHRLGARDRAFGLLDTLTKTGVGWNHCEAWFSLARAYEESGQAEKAREVLWWCIELEEARGVRDWVVVSNYGYVL